MYETVSFHIKGLHCPDCPAKVERTISKLDGVGNIKVNYTNENGYVTYNKNIIGFTTISERIHKMGFEVIKS